MLVGAGVPRAALNQRATKLDPYIPFVLETLAKYPRLRATRLYQMVKQRGDVGSVGHFRVLVQRIRPRPSAEAFQRLRTLAGEEPQVDWGHFGKVMVCNTARPLMAFVMVL
ncbi:MAG: IS21 family transposase, partial [Polyangiaceae bacterium]|nr:IS21 family transposase [Polyangiaceae bacterium]